MVFKFDGQLTFFAIDFLGLIFFKRMATVLKKSEIVFTLILL